MKRNFWIVLGLLAVTGAWLFWSSGRVPSAAQKNSATPAVAAGSAVPTAAAVAVPQKLSVLNTTNALAFRLANTPKSLTQLAGARHAILLQNALIDTDARLDLNIPAHLRATGDPGAFIVQARGPVDARFRAALAAAGAQVVSYIPNNAYLVRVSAAGAGALSGNGLVQAVLPYEPYYKLQPALLGLAVGQQALPPGTALNLGLFATDATAESQVEKLGAKIIGRDRSAFGPVLRVLAPADWTALAQLPGVQVVEPAHQRVAANDLARVTLGVSADSVTTTNYLGLTGQNVMVAVNDTGIDATHPDFATARVLGLTANDLVDTNGHGTHVAGSIAGNGSKSSTVGAAASGSATNANYRGKAPLAMMFSMNMGRSDYDLQTNAALQGALISNNSWDNGNPQYDLSASSYDAATRDALPGLTGSQPVLFVFAAGNNGGGNDNGGEGAPDTILSPGTAKNVITVGALEQLRNITNIVTDAQSNQSAIWQPQTDSSSQVAGYSARGNVGIGLEGTYGRFKPDVVAPGTFVISTRSAQWDTNAFYNPTNVQVTTYVDQIVATNGLVYKQVTVPPNAVSVVISITANKYSPNPFPPDLPVYVKQTSYPTLPANFDFSTAKDGVAIPPDANIATYQNDGFYFAVGNSTNVPVNCDISVAIAVTNSVGDLNQVLEGMNDSLGGYYRYETGTSMAAAAVSGVLALIQDYFTNTLHQTPSPALLKAMLINGSRSVGSYSLAVTNGNNFQGWGLPNLANSLPLTATNLLAIGTNSPLFLADQNPLTALATGDAHTYLVAINTNAGAIHLNFQATLVWTDPPGDPAAAIKLVNNLDLIITNLDTGEVYFGNDFDSGSPPHSKVWNTNGPPNLDTINNVENILLPPAPSKLLAGNYSVTVVGRAVNANAVTAQTNNVVQDYALVISCGQGEVPAALTVTDAGIVSNPTSDQNITFVATTNSPMFNQFVGANTPLLGTNNLPLGTNTVWGPNGLVTIGMTNQWHFYVVTNTGTSADFTNAAFITFNADTLSIPRMGVFADTVANATRPEADIDLYVSTDPALTNLSPVTISNCLAGTASNGMLPQEGGVSLGQGGTEFVVFNNSVPGQVYYIGVKSEDQMASEYAFLPVFTSTPFSTLDKNGNQIVTGMLLPVNIPDGENPQPGLTNVFALAIYPMQVQKVTVTNLNEHQNFGDLFGALSSSDTYTVLNNHDGLGNTYGTLPRVYDDSRNLVAGTVHSDGPGNLENFRGKPALGLWILSEEDDALTQTGRVSTLSLLIQPHLSLTSSGITNTIPAGGWFIDYVDVPPGYTNLTFFATNLPPTAVPALQMYEKLGNEPTLTDYDQRADLTNGVPPGNSISIGPPLNTGRYFIGIYNPSASAATFSLFATLGFQTGFNSTFTFSTNPATALLDDAVTNSMLFVASTQLIASVNVGLVVNSPRVSDLTFTLVSPTGQRILLMENRGGASTNLGHLNITTNFLGTVTPGANGYISTNIIGPVPKSGVLLIDYDFYTVPDSMDVFYDGVDIFSSGLVSGAGQFRIPYGPGFSTSLVIVMDLAYNNAPPATLWTYTPTIVSEDYNYLTFTDDTNLAQVPIKFAIPPYDLNDAGTNYLFSDFESATNGDYLAPTNIFDPFGGWTVVTNRLIGTNNVFWTNNLVSVVADPSTAQGGSNYLALGNGSIARTLPFTVNRKYQVAYAYRGPGIAGWWRGEGDANDSSDPETNGPNGVLVGRFNFPAGEVGQAFQFEDQGDQFQFAGTNTYVQIPQSASLDVGKGGGFTIEGWINPTNVARPQPLVEWLAKVPTNAAVTNLVIKAGPYLDRATGHFYYLLGATNWTTSELWATQLGGHLATIDTANEQNWVFDNFADYNGVNRNLWIGFTNALATSFGWSSGLTNITYTNWLTGQPLNTDGTRNYTFIRGETNLPSGLWVLANNNGFVQGSPLTNKVYGVAEVNDIQTNGVQFWMSVTNSMPGGTNALVSSNGCLYANIMDTNFISHEIVSAPGLLQTNVYQHVALTFNTNSGVAALYLNGTNVATTNLFLTNGVFAPFVPKTDGDLLLGRDMTRYTNNYYGGKMDEMSIYSRALSLAEISAIYRVSALATNGLTGKFDPSVTPAFGLAEAQISLGTTTNFILAANNQWQLGGFTFTATTNSLPLQITGLQPGVLLDSFTISEAALGNLYYLPEQSLEALTGNSAYGNWQLQVWDNRAGAYLTNADQIVSWQLSFVLQTNALIATTLAPQTPTPSTVPPGQTVFYAVDVPVWAHYATNILVSSTELVNLYFNQTNPPDGTGPNDITMLTAQTSGVGLPILVTNGTPPLLPGQRYYLGVKNLGLHAASIVLEVDYDITALTNAVPYTGVLTTNDADAVRYFSFDVTSNAYEATFQLLHLSANADLVIRKGVPLPTLTNSDYGSFNTTNADENIYVLTNSLPVPLSAGRWYLGVFRRDAGPVTYTVLAKELDPALPTIIDLTNAVPFNFTAGPGAALTNFFRFHVTNTLTATLTNYVQGLRFELYNLSGNGDLTVQTNAPPLSPPFFQSSQRPGRSAEMILIQTNSALTNLAADWYLGVPNHESNQITYTIIAVVETNGYFPAFPGAAGAGGGAMGGRFGDVYHVTTTSDAGPGSLRAAVNATNRTVVFDVSGTINLLSPLVITNSYLTVAGQTAPGAGITVAGDLTTVQSAHDVVIRNIRFRPGTADDSLSFTNSGAVIADHISASWSDNNLVSVLGSTNVTVQWSILAENLGLTNLCSCFTNHANGSLLRYGYGALSFHHNLYANNYGGSPRLGDNLTLDFVNNVIYNWGTNAGFSFDDSTNNPSGFTNQLNYVCNYLIAGSNSSLPTVAFFGGTTNTWIFQTNNFIDSNTNGILNGGNTQWGMFTNQYTRFGRPFPVLSVPTDEAFLAYERVLDFAGPDLAMRDSMDANIVTEVRTQTEMNNFTASQPSGLVSWWPAECNANDIAGSNNGSLQGGINFAPGEVGQAFNFNNTNAFVFVPASASLNVGSGSGFTIECWINPATTAIRLPIVEWNTGGNLGVHFWVSVAQNGGVSVGSLEGNVWDTVGGSHAFASGPGIVVTNQFQHVALTYDKSSGMGTIYLNGQVVAQQNLGIFTPQTTRNLYLGRRPLTSGVTWTFSGEIDETKIFSRALSQAEIQSIYKSESRLPSYSPMPLDTDRDGIPDFWEITFGTDPFTPSNNNDRDGDGYTDLEEYNNWLAGPHALTVTNTPVGVDLMQVFGKTGSLSFSVTNGINGFVYLTNVLGAVTNAGPFSNSIAIFTPTNNFGGGTNYGYASFDVNVTNADTVAYFGPVTVSVVVSAVPITYALTNTNPPPTFLLTNATYYLTNNELVPLTVTNTATDANTNVTLSYTLTTTVDIAAMNALGWTNSYVNTTNTTPVISTNGIITWTPSEAQGPGVYDLTTIVSDNGTPPMTATNTFIVTVNEVNTPPFWPTNVPSQTNYSIPALNLLVVTNTALDSDLPPNPLTYQLTVSPGATNAVIDTNGIISWTPTLAQASVTYTFTTIVTDTNIYALFNQSLSATNSFAVNVTTVAAPFVFTQPAQAITGASARLNGMATPNGLPTMAWFQWGTNTAYGSNTPPVPVGNGYNVVYTTNLISGLTPNVPYHFRLVVSNLVGTNYGFDQILDEANVAAWGANYVGQITVPPGLSNVVAIAGAYDHNLALKNNLTAVGWGDNTFGQMAVPPSLNNNLVAVAGGESYSLALKNTGNVVAWGANIFPGETNVPASLTNAVLIASGQYSSLALRSSGNISAWGANISGLTTVPAGLSNSAVAIAGGGFHDLAIRNDGTVVAWGDGSAGQTNVPAGLTNVVAVSAGSFHSLALKYNGTVVAWGDDSAGQTDVPAGLSNVVAVSAGGFHSLALKNDGTIVGWGDNSAGQINVTPGLTNFVAIAAGNLHSLALTPQFVASLTNLVLNLTNGVSATNDISPGGITYYRVKVPTNADFATNILLYTLNGPLNVWFTTNSPPSLGGTATLLFVASTNGASAVLSTTSAPTNIVPGGTYYLGVQNTNSFTVAYGIEVDFHLVPPYIAPINISSIVATNIGGKFGFWLTWFAPSNDLFQVQFTTNLVPANWITFPTPPVISYNTNVPVGPTNAQFNFFDDGSQTGGFGPTRFYRLILLQATNTVTLPPQTNFVVSQGTAVTVTNTAVDTLTNAVLTYSLVNPPAGASISTNGIITWIAGPAGLAARFTTTVTDNGIPAAAAANQFTVFVAPFPAITNVTVTATNVTLQWVAPTNNQFQVQWTTNLAPVVSWFTFPNIITSSNGLFSFTDTNLPLVLKFYRLWLLP